MEKKESPIFSGFVKASGRWGEQTRRHSALKWAELNAYSEGVLVSNWNEEKFDVKSVSKPTPLPSQFDHYYQTTYRGSYNKGPPKVPEELRYPSGITATGYIEQFVAFLNSLVGREHVSIFPCHQPVLDTPKLKEQHNTYITSSMDYCKQSTNSTMEEEPKQEDKSTTKSTEQSQSQTPSTIA